MDLFINIKVSSRITYNFHGDRASKSENLNPKVVSIQINQVIISRQSPEVIMKYDKQIFETTI